MSTEEQKRKHREYAREMTHTVLGRLSRFGKNGLKALKRDEYKCRECGMTNKEHIKKWGRGITVHHKDGKGRYSKEKNHSLDNLITLCLKCHGRIDVQNGKNCKLRENDVREIRRLRKDKGISYRKIAKLYSVNFVSIGRIVRREAWEWVAIDK